MGRISIPELDTPFVFRKRPEAIPGDLRPLWRIGLVLLMLHMASRGGKSGFARLHVLNWALRSREGREALLRVLDGKLPSGMVVVRIEPSLNRAVDFAYGEGLLNRSQGDHLELTPKGTEEAKRILAHEDDLYLQERQFLEAVGKRVTDKFVNDLFGGRV